MPRRRESESDRFARTRAAHRAESAEDYCEAILALSESGDRPVRVTHLATLMGVSHVTVSRLIARLQKEGLVETAPYQPIALTPAGRTLALRARERHEVVLAFLLAAGVPEPQAAIDAEGIEHHVSDATIRALQRLTQRLGSMG